MFMYRRLVGMTRKARPFSSSSSSSSNSIQSLYDVCKKTFTPSGTPPASPQSIQKLCSLLDRIGPADVGIKEQNPEDDRGHGMFGFQQFNRVGRLAQPITYVDVHECDSFTICIFCFPTSSVIPLHDHPGMTVLSKVLYGSLHVKGYDWVESDRLQKSTGPNSSPVKLAKLAVDKVLTAPCTSVLYPSRGGNLHCFTAITPCAVLDILAPPYQEAAGRKCTYYHDYPYSSFPTGNGDELNRADEEGYAWLAQIGTPDDLYMRRGEYEGPAIQI